MRGDAEADESMGATRGAVGSGRVAHDSVGGGRAENGRAIRVGNAAAQPLHPLTDREHTDAGAAGSVDNTKRDGESLAFDSDLHFGDELLDADVIRVDPGPAPYTATDVVAGSIALLILEGVVIWLLTITLNNALFTAASVLLTAALVLVAVRIALARRFREARHARRAAAETFRKLKAGDQSASAEEIARAILVRRGSGRSMTPRLVRRDIDAVETRFGVPLPRVWIIAPIGASLPGPRPPKLQRRPHDLQEGEHAQPAIFEPLETSAGEQDWPSVAVFTGVVAAAAVAFGVGQTGAPFFIKAAAVVSAALIALLVALLALWAKPRFIYAIASTAHTARLTFVTPLRTRLGPTQLDHDTPVLIHARWRRDGAQHRTKASSVRWRFLLPANALLPTVSAPGFDPSRSPWRHVPRSTAWRGQSSETAMVDAADGGLGNRATGVSGLSAVGSNPDADSIT
jgi:Flp pilus assembly protein TadB